MFMADSKITRIIKRDGRVVPFEPSKITEAIRKAFIAVRDGHIGRELGVQSRRKFGYLGR
jgi:transcriptional regulator NrdR family protein